MGGWIKVYRDLQYHPIWQDNLMFKAWMDLLLRVNHQENKILFKKDFVTVKKGQTITSLRKLAASWLCHKDTVKRILGKLQEEDMITFECDNEKTLINVVNYELYQGEENGKTDSDQDSHTDSIKDSDQDSHTTQTRMIKKEKNVKKEKKDNSRFAPPTLEDIRAYCTERKNDIDPEAFISYYESNGWKVGRNPMKDWKATVRTWERRRAEGKPKQNKEEQEINARQREQYGSHWTDHICD